MCGRFALALNGNEYIPVLQRHYPDVQVRGWAPQAGPQDPPRPRYNVAPRTRVAIIRREGADIRMVFALWGLIPHWQKHDTGHMGALKTINARSESITGAEEPSTLWKSLAPSKRCIIPVTGFYEWETKGKHKKPYFIRNPTEGDVKQAPPLMMAGLWDEVIFEGSDEPLLTFTILTTQSSNILSFLHTRMPVLLRNEDDMRLWLDCGIGKVDNKGWTPELSALMKPFGEKSSDLSIYAVPQEVGKVGQESESFIHPVAERKDGIENAFKKQAFSSFTPSSSSAVAGSSPSSSKPAASVDSQSKGKGKRTIKEEKTAVSSDVEIVEDEEKKMAILSEEDHEVVVLDEKAAPSKRARLSQSPAKKPKLATTASISSSGSKKKPIKVKKKEKITSFFSRVD